MDWFLCERELRESYWAYDVTHDDEWFIFQSRLNPTSKSKIRFWLDFFKFHQMAKASVQKVTDLR